MEEIVKLLKQNTDREYAEFQAKLTPTLPKDYFLGVRVPKLREIAKSLNNKEIVELFFKELPHKYYDENLLHSILLRKIMDYNLAIEKVSKFLPYIDCWAVCDTLTPKGFNKNRKDLLEHIKKWTTSQHIYTSRFGMSMLMHHFLDKDFEKEILSIPLTATNDDYYVKMMVAWFYATALIDHWDDTICFLTDKKLPTWIHNKTIQKAVESNRITFEQKEYLKTLRIK